MITLFFSRWPQDSLFVSYLQQALLALLLSNSMSGHRINFVLAREPVCPPVITQFVWQLRKGLDPRSLRIRKIKRLRMVWQKQTIPHFHPSLSCRMSCRPVLNSWVCAPFKVGPLSNHETFSSTGGWIIQDESVRSISPRDKRFLIPHCC